MALKCQGSLYGYSVSSYLTLAIGALTVESEQTVRSSMLVGDAGWERSFWLPPSQEKGQGLYV